MTGRPQECQLHLHGRQVCTARYCTAVPGGAVVKKSFQCTDVCRCSDVCVNIRVVDEEYKEIKTNQIEPIQIILYKLRY